MNDFQTVSNNYSLSLPKQMKKNLGIFYTDLKMSALIMNELDYSLDNSFIDPCCGTGSFLMTLTKAGVNQENIYGADIDKGAISIAKELMPFANILNLNTVTKNAEATLKFISKNEKFDFVVGNPPYAPLDDKILVDTPDYYFLRTIKDSGNNLFVAALYNAFELLKDEGILTYIIPKNFLHVSSYSLLRKKILREKTILSIIDIGAYFKNVRGEQIVLIVKNSAPNDNDVKLKKFENNEFVEKCTINQSFYNNEIILFDSKEDINIFNKLSNTYQNFSDICRGYVGRGKSKEPYAVTGREIRKFGFKNIKVPSKGNQLFIQNIYSSESGIIASFAGGLEAKETVTVFTDGDEKMCRYVLGILHSRLCNYYLYKYIYNSSKLTMHTDAKYLKKLPLETNDKTFDKIINTVKILESVVYLSEEWYQLMSSLDELVYKTYQMSPSEIQYIQNETKKIQSNRWAYDK